MGQCQRKPPGGEVEFNMFNKKVILRSVSLGMSTIVLVSAGLLSGCATIANNNDGDKGNDKNPPAVQENKEDKVMPEFMALVEKGSKPDEIIEFMDKNIAGVSKENASKMIVELEKAQQNYLAELEEKYYSNTAFQESLISIYEKDFDLSKIDSVKDDEHKKILVETKTMGYRVETAEGMFFPIISYEYLKKFSPYAADDMKAYIDIMAEESNKVPAKDGALTIGWNEIVERALAQEDFIKNYSSSSKADSIEELQKRYLTFMLYGLNNTPLFSYDTKKMDTEAMEVYNKALKDDADSQVIQTLGKYMEILEKSEYKLTDEADKFRKNVVDGK